MQQHLDAIGKLLDPDCSYAGNTIVIKTDSHSDALMTMLRARQALDALRAELKGK